MSWEVEYTDQFETWWDGLTTNEQVALDQRIQKLIADGPGLRRPVVGEIKGSKFDPQMKEIVCESGAASLRVLFIFDPRRTAILLLGGDKSGNWRGWYRDAIPAADRLYEAHLTEIEEEGDG